LAARSSRSTRTAHRRLKIIGDIECRRCVGPLCQLTAPLLIAALGFVSLPAEPAEAIAISTARPDERTLREREEGMANEFTAAISLILEDRREDGLRGLPPEAIRETVTVK
jgi:hypothetical protein